MPTTVELQVGLNIEIGGVPIALQANVDTGTEEYSFAGSVQSVVLPIGDFLSFVGMQFGVDVQLPPELDLKAELNYVAAQILYSKLSQGKTTTQLGGAAEFTLSVEGKDYIFDFYVDSILSSGATSTPFVVGASIRTKLAFADLPLVGSIPGFNELALTQIGFSYTNSKPTAGTPVQFEIPTVKAQDNPLYTRSQPDAREAKTYTIVSTKTPQNFTMSNDAFSLTVGLENTTTGATLANFALPLSLPTLPTPPANTLPTPAPYYPKTTSPPGSPVHWLTINKTFGPVNLQQIGLNYSAGEATFGFSASFTVGMFSLSLMGLTITFPMPLPGIPAGDTVGFNLAGLGVSFTSGPVLIGGAFLSVPGEHVTSYYGEVVVQIGMFGFKALGGYTPGYKSNPASFFVYANVDVPLGGIPPLFVTGLAGGFGINRSLVLPTLDELPTYILLPNNAPKEAPTPQGTIATVMPQLEKVFVDQPGEYWVAAGIQFTSFEMIQAFAVLTVAFGVDFQIALIGSCSMTLPTGDPYPIGYVEVDIMASFSSASGLMAIEGKLSPASYLFGSFCKLQGGFAFYIWFTGGMRGQFVVTLGGYNSAYTPPNYYPNVPRLGVNFGLAGLQVSGLAYFALTPSMMMAGIMMSASWSAGPIKAWFSAGFDFLISWSPFFYQADAYLSLGCSVNLGLFTLNVHAGADLVIWGPSFGGKATVDLDVVSFTIQFGSSAPTVQPVGWSQFRTNFLPQDTQAPQSKQNSPKMKQTTMLAAEPAAEQTVSNVIKASASAGLLTSGYTGTDGEVYDWILDPNAFAIVTNSTVPANNGEWTTAASVDELPNIVSSYNTGAVTSTPYLELPPGSKTFSETQVWNPTLNIPAMKLTNVQSYHTVTLRMRSDTDHSGQYSLVITTVAVAPVIMDSNAAMWGSNGDTPSLDAPDMVQDTLVGVTITPIPRVPDQTSAVPLLDLLFAKGFSTGFSYTSAQPDTRYTVTTTNTPASELTISVTGAATETLPNSNYVLNSLVNSWVTQQRAAILGDLIANKAGTYNASQVDLQVMGTQKALVDWPQVAVLGGN